MTAPGFVSTVLPRALILESSEDPSPREWTLELVPLSSVAGVVLDPWGSPIAGAGVVGGGPFMEDLLAAGAVEPGPGTEQAVVAARSDAGGRFQLGGVGRFPLTVFALAPGYARSWPVVCQGEVGPSITLHPTCAVRMTVIDDATEQPIQMFSVHIPTLPAGFQPYRPDEYTCAVASTDPWGYEESGLFSTGAVAASVDRTAWERGDWQVDATVSAPGYQPLRVSLPLRKYAEEAYRVPDVVRMKQVAAALGTLRVHLDGDKVATSSAWVSFREAGGAEYRHWVSFEEGAARVDLPVGTYEVRMIRDLSSVFPARSAATAPGVTGVEVLERGVAQVQLRRGGTETVLRVVTPTGVPSRGAVIDLYRMPTGGMVGTVPLFRLAHAPEYAPARNRFPAGPGELRTVLEPGRYMAVARHPVFSARTSHFTVSEGQVVAETIELGARE